jgi:WD40 repeat protein
MAFSPDGTRLAIGYFEAIRLMTIIPYKPMSYTEIRLDSNCLIHLSFDKQGELIIVGFPSLKVEKYDLDGCRVASYPGIKDGILGTDLRAIQSVHFSCDGKLRAAAKSFSRLIKIYDTLEDRPIWTEPYQIPQTQVIDMAFASEEGTIFGFLENPLFGFAVCIWDAGINTLLHKVLVRLENGGARLSLALCQGSPRLVVVASNTMVMIYDVEKNKEVRCFETGSTSAFKILFADDNKLLVYACTNGDILLHDISDL